jgi:hypothetical protein
MSVRSPSPPRDRSLRRTSSASRSSRRRTSTAGRRIRRLARPGRSTVGAGPPDSWQRICAAAAKPPGTLPRTTRDIRMVASTIRPMRPTIADGLPPWNCGQSSRCRQRRYAARSNGWSTKRSSRSAPPHSLACATRVDRSTVWAGATNSPIFVRALGGTTRTPRRMAPPASAGTAHPGCIAVPARTVEPRPERRLPPRPRSVQRLQSQHDHRHPTVSSACAVAR